MNAYDRIKDILENCDILIIEKENSIPNRVYYIELSID